MPSTLGSRETVPAGKLCRRKRHGAFARGDRHFRVRLTGGQVSSALGEGLNWHSWPVDDFFKCARIKRIGKLRVRQEHHSEEASKIWRWNRCNRSCDGISGMAWLWREQDVLPHYRRAGNLKGLGGEPTHAHRRDGCTGQYSS